MFKNLKFLIFVFIIVFVSGCVSGGEETIEASHDVLRFGEITTIPIPPVFAGDTFSTSFEIENLDDFEDAKNVNLILYDWGICKPISGKPGNWISGNKESYLKNFGEIMPKDVKFIECQFQSPSQEEIAGMKATCPIRFSLSYDFSGTTTTDVMIISDDKYRNLQKSGKTPKTVSTQTKSRGPIKVDFEFLTDQPIRTSSKLTERKIPMYIRIENKGKGKIQQTEEKNKIKLSVSIPNDLLEDCSNDICGDWFTASSSGNNCKLTMKDDRKIEFVKEKSEPIRCELVSPSTVKDEKTYYISANVQYTYEIDKKTDVAIKPIKVV